MAATSDPLELRLERDGERLFLRAPAVGLFTGAVPKGQLLSPGQIAGALKVLDVGHPLVVPAGATGRIASERPERVHEPVDFGAVLYELAPIEAGGDATGGADAEECSSQLGFGSPLAGRFWHRASPDAPAFVQVGDTVQDGQVVGLIEVMKTFTQVQYRAGGHLPERGVVADLATGDGEEVEEGQVLLVLEEG